MSKTVIVLGAGFTRAFVPKAPLLVDDYGADELVEEIKPLKYASSILDAELKLANAGASGTGRLIDLERLMTRLESRMPYDFETPGATQELDVLLSKLKWQLLTRLRLAKSFSRPDQKVCLRKLADYCLEERFDCLTFNYDDVFDEQLWVSGHSMRWSHWSPDGGYGFFCRSSRQCVKDDSTEKPQSNMVILKLHGSMNWRIKKGQPKPYGTDAIMHHQDWSGPWVATPKELLRIDPILEPEPFVVPPVLAKSDLVTHPILRIVWSRAFKLLAGAGCYFCRLFSSAHGHSCEQLVSRRTCSPYQTISDRGHRHGVTW